jgi:cyclopropane-fatty-acyl-phospholipid synthase
MFALLRHLFAGVIKRGRLDVIDWRGRVHTFGDGSGPRIAIRLKDRRTGWNLIRDPEFAVGDAYMHGRLIMEQGSIYDFIDLAARNMATHPLPRWAQAFARLRHFKRRFDEDNRIGRARRNARHHYDIDPRIYDLFLDRHRQYSCAYFAPGVATLDEAQRAKQRHIAAKLQLKSGLSVLDIGSGWGGLARYLAEISDTHVTGITLSPQQYQAACAVPRPDSRSEPQHGSVTFKLEDYRETTGAFDRIVSVGMFEHVGMVHYHSFFENIARLLKDDGIALIHAIGRLDGPAPTNPFINRYIFPGSSTPALSELMTAIEGSGLYVTDVEILRLHYAETLR